MLCVSGVLTGLLMAFRHKALAERDFSRLKTHLSLENHKVGGLRKILIHTLLCIIAMLLISLAVHKTRKTRTNKDDNKANTHNYLCVIYVTFKADQILASSLRIYVKLTKKADCHAIEDLKIFKHKHH
jgi:transposase